MDSFEAIMVGEAVWSPAEPKIGDCIKILSASGMIAGIVRSCVCIAPNHPQCHHYPYRLTIEPVSLLQADFEKAVEPYRENTMGRTVSPAHPIRERFRRPAPAAAYPVKLMHFSVPRPTGYIYDWGTSLKAITIEATKLDPKCGWHAARVRAYTPLEEEFDRLVDHG